MGLFDFLQKNRKRKPQIANSTLSEHTVVLSEARLTDTHIGRFSYVGKRSALNNVRMGNFCSLGPDVEIGYYLHPTDFVSTYPAFYSNKNIGCPVPFTTVKKFDDSVPQTIIENDVWIGAKAIVLGGITIGTGAIVAAGSVVVKDVPPYAIVGGNPAKLIKFRFTEPQIEALLKSKWWEWDQQKYLDNVGAFSDIETFIKRLSANDL